MNFKVITLFFGLCLCTSSLFAAFEEIDISAEGEKVAEACTAKPLGAASVYYNPAGLAFLTQREVNLQYSFLAVDLDNDNLSYFNVLFAYPFGPIKTCFTYDRLNSNLYNEQVVSLSAAYKFYTFRKEDISTGIRFKLLRVGYEQNAYTQVEQLFINNGYSKMVVGLDWGMMAYSDKGFSCGFNLKNINQPDVSLDSSGSTLPLDLKIGTGYDFAFKTKTYGMDDIKCNIDFNYNNTYDSFRFGVEPSFLNYTLIPGIGLGVGSNNLLFISTGLTYRIVFEGIKGNLDLYNYTLKINYAFDFYLGGQSLGTYGDHYLSISFSF